MQSNPITELPVCACGCGEPLPNVRRPKPGRRFIRGHQWRARHAVDYIVDPVSGCWVWQRCGNGRGYGFVFRGGIRSYAHRAFYEDANGPIPDDLVIDHLCRNPSCVNPDHLEAVTFQENMRRGVFPSRRGAKQTPRELCKKGLHRFTPENTIIEPDGGRKCRECVKAYKRAWYLRNRARILAKR